VETEGLIGFFVNHLVLRTDLSGNPSFRELLGRVREVALGAYAHQDVPFEKLVEALNPERSLSHTPLFQVLFVLQNAPSTNLELPGLTLGRVDVDHGMSKFDVALFGDETEHGLVVSCLYKRDLFGASTIKRMLAHYAAMLAIIVGQPDARLDDLQGMLTESDRRQQLTEKREREAAHLQKFRTTQPRPIRLS
jgi:non-ribosomal peptide synthetase component F